MSPRLPLLIRPAALGVALTCAGGLAAGAAASVAAPATSPSPARAIRLAEPDRPALMPVIVTLRAQVSAAAYAGRPQALERALRRTAALPVPAGLARAGRRRLWLVNAVALRLPPDEIRRLASDPAVASVEPDRRLRVIDRRALADEPPPPAPFARGDWGLAAIFAPAAWRDYGIDGTGVRVGSIDSGIDASHPDLAGKVVAWRDFVNERPAPYDDNGHGTHTIGTIVGGQAGGLPIGVAPGARVVVAKALDADGSTNMSTLLAAAQWITDPDGDPMTDDAPTVVNASWGGMGVDPDGALRRLIRRWRELGIVPVFSAGNSGPAAASVVRPASYPESLAVAATDPDGRVAAFSSRGPAASAGPDPYQLGSITYQLGSIRPAPLKPDLAAPGEDVLSSRLEGGYVSWSGTSMAAPHVAGVVALIRQAAPDLAVSGVESLLRATATDLGPPGPDQMAGAGLVNALGAVRAILGPVPSGPGLRLIATPPALTNQAAPAFGLHTGGAPVQVRLDGQPATAAEAGPIVRVPIEAPGRHLVELSRLDEAGAPSGPPLRFSVEIDRSAPSLRFVVKRARLLGVGYRVEAAGSDIVPDSLRVRTSDNEAMAARRGGHVFTERGPYWLELRAADRAGNVRRVRRVVAWPAALVARRLTWNRAFVELDYGDWLARARRRRDGRFRGSSWLARLIERNLESGRFVSLARTSDRPPPGAVGVWSQGRTLVLVVERGWRRYLLMDQGGRVRRESRPLAARRGDPATNLATARRRVLTERHREMEWT